MTITSPHNDTLKEIRKLTRRRERARTSRFVAEGEDLVAAAAAAGWEPVHLLCAAGSGLAGDEVAPELLGEVSALGSGTRVLGVYATRWAAPAAPRCVYLHGVGDPGNVGTVLRAAHAFGSGSVVLGPGCADPFGPKAVRASMGAVFRVPIARAQGVGGLPGERIALAARRGEPLGGDGHRAGGHDDRCDRDVVLVLGAEREGLPEEIVAACERVAHIPIAGDSLNVAMAATIALYELSRGRPAAAA